MRGGIIAYSLFIIIEEYILYNIEKFKKKEKKKKNTLFTRKGSTHKLHI